MAESERGAAPRVSVRGRGPCVGPGPGSGCVVPRAAPGRQAGGRVEGFGHHRFGGAVHRDDQGARVEPAALAGGAHDAGQDLPGVGPRAGVANAHSQNRSEKKR